MPSGLVSDQPGAKMVMTKGQESWRDKTGEREVRDVQVQAGL